VSEQRAVDPNHPIDALMNLLAALGVPGVLVQLAGMLAVCIAILAYVAVAAMFMIWWERKISAHMQGRLGPMRVGGWHGWAQSLADGIKLLMKEDIIPTVADKLVFVLAPIVVFATALATYVIIPFGPGVMAKNLNIGVLYYISISSLTVVGIIMAGWSSNNKYSVLGAMRSAAQAVSYEVPLVVSVLGVIMITGTLDMQKIIEYQGGSFLGIFPSHWLVWPQIVGFLCYFTASLAECNRLPFDIPEAESELVAGFHVEYSGMRFAIFFLAEYANMFVVTAIAVTMFLGGWKGPVLVTLGYPLLAAKLWGVFWFLFKCYFLIFVQMWLRWTLARLRVDQLMHFGWKVLLPISLLNLGGTGLVIVLFGQ
jgi:NADH-quinone oxidoreductase subunit H